ncbi:MAG: thiamine diphosphokinase [Dorea sp.]|nr:thiamine diphosphokinase [Dorea sp.]
MHNRIVIVSGGELQTDFVLPILKNPNEYIIAVDKGINFFYKHQIKPNYIVGDFDSADDSIRTYFRTETNIPIRELNPIKDESDTETAIRMAMTLGANEIIILGGTGGRMDHFWANVQSLKIPLKAGVRACIVDEQNYIYLLAPGKQVIKKADCFGKYISFFPLGEDVYGFTLEGFAYPTYGMHLTSDKSLCVSNEVEDDEASISFRTGTLLVMETRDKQ